MWPSRSDMSRDECRKCLRCLELDAYGNMVSVLRAQGPLTDEKQKLLGELSKVLHISNERHRAEIRRAVNDEKLSVIAEQLNGPNTCTDWAIEGRRTIPLLPRLKAHTAFTGLANSLSLVIASANEKKLSPPSRVEDSIVKAETVLHEENEQEERSTAKVALLHSELSIRGKKRKRFLPESPKNEKCRKVESTETRLRDPEVNSVFSRESRDVSPLPIGHSECPNVVQVSIVTPSSTADTARHNDNNIPESSLPRLTCSSTNSSNHHKFTIAPSNIRDSDETNFVNVQTTAKTHTLVQNPPNCQDISNVVNSHPVSGNNRANVTDTRLGTNSKAQQPTTAHCIGSKNLQSNENETHNRGSDKIVDKMVISEDEGTKISRPDSTTSSTPCPKRIVTSTFCMTTKPVISSSTPRAVTIHSESTASGGPGPPSTKQSTVVTYKKMPPGKLNHHSGTKMGIALNSNKTLKINAHPNARVATKANVIVVKKGTSRGVTLSHGGKEVVGKVIMGGKNLCLASQKNANSIAVLPHRAVSNNGEQTVTMLSTVNANHPESLKTSGKTGNMIVLDIRHDVLDKNKVLSHLLEASEAVNTESKTATAQNSNSARPPIENNHTYDSVNSVDSECRKSVSPIDSPTSESYIDRVDKINARLYSNAEAADSSDTAENREIFAEVDEEILEAHGVLGAQTGIYNFESADGIMMEDQMEESIQTSGIDIFSTALASADVNLENFHYVDNGGDEIVIETRDDEIVIETRNEVTAMPSPISSIEQLDELSDS